MPGAGNGLDNKEEKEIWRNRYSRSLYAGVSFPMIGYREAMKGMCGQEVISGF